MQTKANSIDLGHRHLSSWAKLEQFIFTSSDAMHPQVSFLLKIHLEQFVRQWFERIYNIKNEHEHVHQIQIEITESDLWVAGCINIKNTSSWFVLKMGLVSEIDKIGLIVHNCWKLGPETVSHHHLYSTLIAPFLQYKEITPTLNMQPILLKIQSVQLILQTIKKQTAFNFPKELSKIWIDTIFRRDQIWLNGTSVYDETNNNTNNSNNEDNNLDEIPSALSENEISQMIIDSDINRIENLLEQNEKDYKYWYILNRLSENASISPNMLTKLRRMAQKGEIDAMVVLKTYYQQQLNSHRAIYWYQQMEQKGKDVHNLFLWAITNAKKAFHEQLSAKMFSQRSDSQNSEIQSGELGQYGLDVTNYSNTATAIQGIQNIKTTTGVHNRDFVDEQLEKNDNSWFIEADIEEKNNTITKHWLNKIYESYSTKEDWRGLLSFLEKQLTNTENKLEQFILHQELANIKIKLGIPSRAIPHLEALVEISADHIEPINFLRDYYQKHSLHDARIKLEAKLILKKEDPSELHKLEKLAQEAALFGLKETSTELWKLTLKHKMTAGTVISATESLENYAEWSMLISIWKTYLSTLTEQNEIHAACIKIAYFMAKLGETMPSMIDSAIKIYQKVLSQNPTHDLAIEGLICIYEKESKIEELEKLLLQIYQKEPRTEKKVAYSLLLANLYAIQLNRKEESEIWYQTSMQFTKDPKLIMDTRIKQFEYQEDWQGLVDFLQKQMELPYDNSLKYELLLHLGDIYLVRLGDPLRANSCFLKATAIKQ